MPYKDAEKRKEMGRLYNRRSYHKNRDKNRDTVNQRKREFYARNAEALKSQRKEAYRKDPSKFKQVIYGRRHNILEWFVNLCRESDLRCRCGEAHPACLDFHHRDGTSKSGLISSSIRSSGWGTERVLVEMEKCDILCANCHRAHHRQEPPSRPERRWIWDHKASRPCGCGESRPQCLDFHHRDPATKTMSVSTMVTTGLGRAVIEAEIEKCDLLCANCHRKHHSAWQVKSRVETRRHTI